VHIIRALHGGDCLGQVGPDQYFNFLWSHAGNGAGPVRRGIIDDLQSLTIRIARIECLDEYGPMSMNA
jgi:hypothetical protein